MNFFKSIGTTIANIFSHPAATVGALAVGLSAIAGTSQTVQASLSAIASVPGLPITVTGALTHSSTVLSGVASVAMILAAYGKSFAQPAGPVIATESVAAVEPPMPDAPTPSVVRIVTPKEK